MNSRVRRPKHIFVFGSNLAGRHGKGAALTALREHGAIYGQGVGLQGNSYAIPTKDHQLRRLSLEQIAKYVEQFCDAVLSTSVDDAVWLITPIGTGLAGYQVTQIRPLFSRIEGIKNVIWLPSWNKA